MSFIRRFVQQDHDLVLDTSAVAVDNVFTTFATVVTAANARSGITRVKLTQSVTVSSSTYNLSRIIFVADFEVNPTLTLSGTATVTGAPPRELVNVILNNGKTDPLWTLTADAQMTLRGLAALGGSATDQLIELDGKDFDLYFEDGAGFSTVPSGFGVINNANATTSIVYFKDNSTTTPDVDAIAVSGAGTMDLRYFPVSGHTTHIELATLFTTVAATLYKPQPFTVSPAQITATANNYSPVGLEHANIMRVNSDAAYDVTGLDAANAGTGWFNPYKLIVNSGSFALTLKHQNAGSTAANRFINTGGTDLVLAASGGSAIVYYDPTDTRWRAFSVSVVSSGEANTASNVGTGAGLLFKQKTGVDLEFKRIAAGYAVTVSNGTSDVTISRSTVVTTLTDGASIAVDADLGPNYMVTIAGNRTLSNPTNSAVGKELWVAVAQDGTGGRTLAFDTNFISADGYTTINATASAVSIVHAIARDFGGGVKWYYTVTSIAETLGEANTASNVGAGATTFKQKTGVDLEFKTSTAGYASTITSGTNENTFALKTTVTTLTDAATIAIDAALGPQYMVTLGGNRTLGNPTNAVVGQHIEIAIAQDGTGSRTLAFSADWSAVDNTITVNPTASSVSYIYAVARDFGGGLKWYYTLNHASETGSGEANTASNVGTGTGLVFKQKSGVDLEFRSILQGYGLSVTNNTSDITLTTKTAITTLTDGATIAVDAAVGPQYMVTIAGNRTLSNPTNSAVGQMLIVVVSQDGTGGRTLAFDTDFINAGQLYQVAQTASAVSVVVANARNFGGGVKWYYSIYHGESVYQITPTQLTAIAATGTLTNTANFANNDTVTTGTKTYTFQTALTNVNGNVLIGASASASLDNLIAAINLGAGSGTVYAAATTANGFVSAAASAGDTMDVTALVVGSAGNTIATTETSANASWGGSTLSGGNDETNNYNPTEFSAANTLRISTSATYNLTGMVSTASQARKRIINVGSFNLVIKHQNTGSTAANRFIAPGGLDVTILPDDSIDFECDKTASRWRLV
jgi:hypothetical protein